MRRGTLRLRRRRATRKARARGQRERREDAGDEEGAVLQGRRDLLQLQGKTLGPEGFGGYCLTDTVSQILFNIALCITSSNSNKSQQQC